MPVCSQTTLETTVVSDQNTETTNGNIQTFDKNQFIYRYSSLSDFLQTVSGIQVRESGLGSPVSLSIRGSSHQQIKFVVDGLEINDAQYGGFDLNKIPLHQIEKITLVKGNTSELTSANAIGGTVYIDTLSTNASSETSVFATLGSFDQIESGISQSYAAYGEALLSLNHIQAANDYPYPVPLPFGSTEIENDEQNLRNNEYEKTSALLKWQKQYSPQITLNVKTLIQKDNKHLPDYQRNTPFNEAYVSSLEKNIETSVKFSPNGAWTSNTHLAVSEKNETFEDPTNVIGIGFDNTDYFYSNRKLKQEFSFQTDNYSLNTGFILSSEAFEDDHKLISNDVKCLTPTSTCDIQADQKTLEWQQYLGLNSDNQNHNLAAGFSLLEVNKSQQEKYGNQSQSKHQSNYDTWSIQYGYLGLPNHSINFNIAEAVRIPTLYELFGDRGLVKSNIALKPEQSINFSASIDTYWRQHTFNQSLFYRTLKDAIVGQFSSGVGTYKNMSSAEVIGWEGSALLNMNNDIALQVSVLFQDSLTESEIKASNHKKLAGVFHKSAKLKLSKPLVERLSLQYTYQYNDDLWIDTANLEKQNGMTTHALAAHYHANHFSAVFSANNLLDARNKDQFNRPSAGRTFSLNLHYQF